MGNMDLYHLVESKNDQGIVINLMREPVFVCPHLQLLPSTFAQTGRRDVTATDVGARSEIKRSKLDLDNTSERIMLSLLS